MNRFQESGIFLLITYLHTYSKQRGQPTTPSLFTTLLKWYKTGGYFLTIPGQNIASIIIFAPQGPASHGELKVEVVVSIITPKIHLPAVCAICRVIAGVVSRHEQVGAGRWRRQMQGRKQRQKGISLQCWRDERYILLVAFATA